MRSKNRLLVGIFAVLVLALGTFPFPQSISGGGVVPVGNEAAGDSELVVALRLFTAAEEKRFENDKKTQELLQGMLKAQQEETEATKRCEVYLQIVARNNQKIYEGLMGSGAVPQEGVSISAPENGQVFPTDVSIKLDPANITERYKAIQIDNHKIAIGDTFGNEFLWQYDPIGDKLELRYLLYKDKGTSGLVVCNLDQERGYVQVPDGVGIMTPKFPVPHIHKSP